MGLFNLFGKKNQSSLASNIDTPKEIFNEDKELNEGDSEKILSVIKKLRDYMMANHETTALEDALTCPDPISMDNNLALLKSRFNSMINTAANEYEGLSMKLDYSIGFCKRNGLIDLEEFRTSQKDLVVRRMGEVEKIRDDTTTWAGESESIKRSYEKGFKRGIMARAQAQISENGKPTL